MSKILEIPEMWEELAPDQFAYLLRLVFEAKPDEVTIHDLLLKFADYLLGEKQFIAPDKRTQYYKLVNDVAGTMDWIFARDEDDNFLLNFETTYNLLPELAGYLGPQSHGSDLTFGEYKAAVDMMNRYSQEKDLFFLDALCGILYRKPALKKLNPEGITMRENFSKHKIDRYARNFEKVPEYLKWGVYLWFAYFNRYLIEGGPFIIDGNTLSFESLFERDDTTDGAEKDQVIGLMSIVFTLADSGTFGNVSQTEEALLFPVLMKLLHDKQMFEKLKRNDRN